MEAFKIFAQVRVHPQLHALQLNGSPLRMRRVNGFFSHFSQISKKVRHNTRTRGRHCLRTRAHGRGLLLTRPWCLRRRRRSPRTSLSSTCSTMGVGGGVSGIQLASGTAGGWPLPMGPRLAILSGGLHGSSAVGQVTMLRWCFWAGAWFDSGYMFQPRPSVEVPLQFIVSGGYCSNLQGQVRTVPTVQGCRLPCHGAEDVSFGLVQQITVIPQLQSIGTVFDVLVVQVEQIRAKSWETVEIPQLQLDFSWSSCCSPVVCNDRCPWSMSFAVHRQ